jgi:hypothetical protein
VEVAAEAFRHRTAHDGSASANRRLEELWPVTGLPSEAEALPEADCVLLAPMPAGRIFAEVAAAHLALGPILYSHFRGYTLLVGLEPPLEFDGSAVAEALAAFERAHRARPKR